MGRKRRHARNKVRAIDDDRPKGPSRTTVRMTILASALVAILLITVVVLYDPGDDEDDDPDDHEINPTPTNKAPVPKASATPSEVFVGQNITFDGSMSRDQDGTVKNYTWEFHAQTLDGPVMLVKYQRKFTMSFDHAAIYYVVLKVTDDKGLSNSTVSVNKYAGMTIIIRNKNPIAEAGPDIAGAVGKAISFNGSASFDTEGTIINYTWDLGDGTKAWGEKVNHTYTITGIYYVMLTVKDDRGFDNWDTVRVDVSA